MGQAIKVRLEGLDALRQKLAGLGKAAVGRVLRPAVAAAGRLVLKAIRARIPRRSGQLARAVKLKVRTYPRAVVAAINARKGFASEYRGRRIDPAYYAHLAGPKRKATFVTEGWEASKAAASAKLAGVAAEKLDALLKAS